MDEAQFKFLKLSISSRISTTKSKNIKQVTTLAGPLVREQLLFLRSCQVFSKREEITFREVFFSFDFSMATFLGHFRRIGISCTFRRDAHIEFSMLTSDSFENSSAKETSVLFL